MSLPFCALMGDRVSVLWWAWGLRRTPDEGGAHGMRGDRVGVGDIGEVQGDLMINMNSTRKQLCGCHGLCLLATLPTLSHLLIVNKLLSLSLCLLATHVINLREQRSAIQNIFF